jgi:4-alpha-glucanotransferase
MLVCAEDLGIIPRSCPKVLEELRIPGNDVQRWVKDWLVLHDFLEPKDYRKLSVAMLSTHDTTNWPAWWENEAGTADEGLFKRRCLAHSIDFDSLKNKLFDPVFSRHGRLRWLNRINSLETLANILGKNISELADINDIYLNTYHEKEKLWLRLEIIGLMREKCDPEITKAALNIALMSESVFSIQLLNAWLFLAGMFKDDSYKYRINTPGSISEINWSLLAPLPLEKLLDNPICGLIEGLVRSSKRI